MSLTILRNFLNKQKSRYLSPKDFKIRKLNSANNIQENIKCDEMIIPSKRHTRYRNRLLSQTEMTNDQNKMNVLPNIPASKCKKMAVLLAYCGSGYYGMQRAHTKGLRTIEDDLFKALLDANYITIKGFENEKKIGYQRSSRTDKGVSAIHQIVSLNLPIDVNMKEINKKLPDKIKVFGIKRVIKSFDAKDNCSGRTYSYTVPTYVFDPKIRTLEKCTRYRISSDQLQKFSNILSTYEGVKKYHNFTDKKFFDDPKSRRNIRSFRVERVIQNSDTEYAIILVTGQSFMLHQIRKMMGLAIAYIREQCPRYMMDAVFSEAKIPIPTAPGVGLVLDKVHFDNYNRRFQHVHDALKWDELDDELQKFKHEYIYPIMFKDEIENPAISWVNQLKRHSYKPI